VKYHHIFICPLLPIHFQCWRTISRKKNKTNSCTAATKSHKNLHLARNVCAFLQRSTWPTHKSWSEWLPNDVEDLVIQCSGAWTCKLMSRLASAPHRTPPSWSKLDRCHDLLAPHQAILSRPGPILPARRWKAAYADKESHVGMCCYGEVISFDLYLRRKCMTGVIRCKVCLARTCSDASMLNFRVSVASTICEKELDRGMFIGHGEVKGYL
jgi:hypothetical protein